MRGTLESCFTAYISHTFVDLPGEENGPMRGGVCCWWLGGVIVCELHVYQNVFAERGGGIVGESTVNLS